MEGSAERNMVFIANGPRSQLDLDANDSVPYALLHSLREGRDAVALAASIWAVPEPALLSDCLSR